MVTKLVSLATGIVFLDVYLQSQLSSNDPLFLFASSGLLVNLGLLLVASSMIAISFRAGFKHWWGYLACAAAAIVFGIVGFAGAFLSDTVYWIPQTFLSLDYLMLLEAGVVFGICALTYKHEPLLLKLRWARLNASLTHKLAYPVPKILHSPTTSSRTRRTQPA